MLLWLKQVLDHPFILVVGAFEDVLVVALVLVEVLWALLLEQRELVHEVLVLELEGRDLLDEAIVEVLELPYLLSPISTGAVELFSEPSVLAEEVNALALP
jgi:hypothetical protein